MTNPFSDQAVIEAAKGCETYAQLQKKVRWPIFQGLVDKANELKLGLNWNSPRKEKFELPSRANPKPQAKGKKQKGEGE